MVEGQTDKTVISYLANLLGVFRHDYTIVECGSKSAMPSHQLLLNRFSIPYEVVYNADHQAYKGADNIAAANKDSLRIENTTDRQRGSTILLTNDIEEEIGITDPSTKNKPFLAMTHVTHATFVLTEQLAQKIRQVYARK